VRKILRLLAAIILLIAPILWLTTGASRSWFTKIYIPVTSVDAVTGLERTDWKLGFEPGMDFLMVSAVTAVVLAGASFLFREKSAGT
jgi:hypothetical protein